MEERNGAEKWLPYALLALVVLVSLSPIRSYDYFWQLASGRWIADHGELPTTDPFTTASDAGPWVNGEWLFQIVLYGSFRVADHAGVTVIKALIVAALFAWMFSRLRRSVTAGVATLLILVAVAGSLHRIDVRPETAAVVMLPLALTLMRMPASSVRTVLLALLTIGWINVHPSAILLPFIVGLFALGDLAGSRLEGERWSWRASAAQFVATGAGLLVNPYGIEGLIAPVRLAAFLRRSGVTNLEWSFSAPRLFPLLYLAVLVGVIVFLLDRDRAQRLGSLFVFLFLGLLAIRYVRNHAFFFLAFPLLLAPAIGRRVPQRAERGVWLLAILVAAFVVAGNFDVAIGPDPARFPIRAVAQLERAGLEGNIYNPDQFGGFLIWTFYPERRALTDGRNELYHRFLAEYERARLDSREWSALLGKYDIALAVDEYRRERIEVVDAITGRRRLMPGSQVYFPRDRWALVGFDDVGLVFARRDRFPREVLERIEFRALIPDAGSADEALVGDRSEVEREIERAVREIGPSRVIVKLDHFNRVRREREVSGAGEGGLN